MNTIIHVPIDDQIRKKAVSMAKKQGYSSLQEVLRLFMVQYIQGDIKSMFVIGKQDDTSELENVLSSLRKNSKGFSTDKEFKNWWLKQKYQTL